MNDKKFESKYGFDANGETLTNLGNPIDMSDGINKYHFEQFKGVLTYDQNRGYPIGFVTVYNNGFYLSNKEIKSPAGVFNDKDWNILKAPPAWRKISLDTTKVSLDASDYIIVNTERNPLDINLPKMPREGETIYIYDVGGHVGTNKLSVTSTRNNIRYDKLAPLMSSTINLTIPLSMSIFTYINGMWNVKVDLDIPTLNKIIHPNVDEHKAQSCETIILMATEPSDTKFKLILPTYANSGDYIKITTPYRTDASIDIVVPLTSSATIHGSKTFNLTTYKDATIVYNANINRWDVAKSVKDKETILVSSDLVTLKPYQDVVVKPSTTNVGNIRIILPKDPSVHDNVHISLIDVNENKTLTIDGGASNITYNNNRLGATASGKYYTQNSTTTKTLSFKPDERRIGGIELVWNGTAWIISRIEQFLYFTNSATPQHAGIVALVNDNDILENVMKNSEVAITPSQLQKRSSTELRKGISALATKEEVLEGKSTDKIVTPLTLHNTKSSETQQGLLYIASQSEVDAGTIHTKAITPLTLDKKRPNESGKYGVVTFVSSSEAVAGKARDSAGTGVYNRSDASKVVTPKTLHQLVATESAIGLVYKASISEVQTGVADNDTTPLFITPYALSQRTATEKRTGIAKLASKQTVLDTTNHSDIVTPSTLHSVQSTYDLKGLARFWNSSAIPKLGDEETGIVDVKSNELDMRIVSQNSLNDLFKYYLPKKATAVNSDKVGGNGVDNLFLLNRSHVVTPKQTFNDLTAPKFTSTNGTITNLTSSVVSIGDSRLVYDGVLSVKNKDGTSFGNIKANALHAKTVRFDNESSISSTTASETVLGFGSSAKGGSLVVKSDSVNLVRRDMNKSLDYDIVDTGNMKLMLAGTFASLVDDNTFTCANTFTKPLKCNSLSNRTMDGYMFHIFPANSSEITNNQSWLNLPPTNITGRSVVDGKVVYATDGDPKYDMDYVYERFVTPTSIQERLMVGERMFRRFTNKTTSTTNGWSMIYGELTKPSAIEINAVDRDEVMTGKIQVTEWLDIIVDENNTFRLRPDKDTKSVVYAWLEKE